MSARLVRSRSPMIPTMTLRKLMTRKTVPTSSDCTWLPSSPAALSTA